MELFLLSRIFENTEQSWSLEDVTEKAHLFLDCVKDNIEDLGGDYWIQLSREWDLNIWWEDGDETSVEMSLYPCKRGEDGLFETDTRREAIRISQPKADFPVDEKKLAGFLEWFGNIEYYNTGVDLMSGGFAIAEYDGCDEDEEDEEYCFLHITLTWGIKNECEDRATREHYQITIADFNRATSNQEIYESLED